MIGATHDMDVARCRVGPVEVDGVIHLGLTGGTGAGVCGARDVAARHEIPQRPAGPIAPCPRVDELTRGIIEQPALPGRGVRQNLAGDRRGNPAVTRDEARLLRQVQGRRDIDDDRGLLTGPAACRARTRDRPLIDPLIDPRIRSG